MCVTRVDLTQEGVSHTVRTLSCAVLLVWLRPHTERVGQLHSLGPFPEHGFKLAALIHQPKFAGLRFTVTPARQLDPRCPPQPGFHKHICKRNELSPRVAQLPWLRGAEARPGRLLAACPAHKGAHRPPGPQAGSWQTPCGHKLRAGRGHLRLEEEHRALPQTELRGLKMHGSLTALLHVKLGNWGRPSLPASSRGQASPGWCPLLLFWRISALLPLPKYLRLTEGLAGALGRPFGL